MKYGTVTRFLANWNYDKKQGKYIAAIPMKTGKIKRIYHDSPEGVQKELHRLISKALVAVKDIPQPKEETDNEFWNRVFKEERERKRNEYKSRIEQVAETLGLKIEKRTEYHFSLYDQSGYRVDYFPTSGKYHDVEQNKRGRVSADRILSIFPNQNL